MTSSMVRKFLKITQLLLAAALLVGCSEQDRDLHLAKAAPDDQNESQEIVRKQQLQLVQYLDLQSQTYQTMDAGGMAFLILTHCQAQIGVPLEGEACKFVNSPSDVTYCEEMLCTARARLCQADLIRRLVVEPGTVLNLTDEFGNERYRVEPQSSGTNAALMIRAEQVVMSAVNRSAAVLDGLLSTSTPAFGYPTCSGLGSNQLQMKTGQFISMASLASTTMVEASQLSEQVTNQAADAVLAVADAEMSSTLSPLLQNERSITGGALSRGQAVRALVSETMAYSGPDSGVAGLSTPGLCSTADLSAQASRALELLREAAPPPADVEDPGLLIGDFVNADRPTGSIKQRLVQRWGRDLGTALEDAVSLRLQDFADAREYLKQERQVFARSLTKTLVGPDDSYARYAATAAAPSPREPAYWGAVARYGQLIPLYPRTPGAYESDSSGIGLSFPELRYFAARSASDFARRIGILPRSERKNADQLALLGRTLLDRAPGYVKFTYNDFALDVAIHLDQEPLGDLAKLIVVAGEDGLHCAARGTIEGVPCSQAELDAAAICTPQLDGNGDATCHVERSPDGTRFYVLHSKTGGTKPGDYEALLGASVYATAPYWTNNTGIIEKPFAIATDIDRRLAEILQPGKNNCSRPRLSCAGADFDERMPLENELSDDGDAVESSWRHYLGLAKSAAAEADLLGKDFIVSQLEADTRKETVESREEERRQEIENALSDLQSLCGTDVDPMQLLLALSGIDDPKDLSAIRQKHSVGTTVTCASSSACDTASGYSCFDGVCLKDPLDPARLLETTTDPSLKQALARLSECIGKDVSAPFISLGDRPVCVWYPKDIPAQLCSGSTSDKPCPRLAEWAPASPPDQPQPYWKCDETILPAGRDTTNTEIKLVDRQLGYFSSRSAGGIIPTICDKVATARGNLGSPVLDEIIASDVFHPYNLGQLAPRVGWTAYFTGGSAVTLDQHPLYKTQSSVFKKMGWCQECDTCTAGEDCAKKYAKLDDMMLRAVATIRGTAVGHMRDVNMPFYIEKTSEAFVEKGNWTNVYPGTQTVPLKIVQKEYNWDGSNYYPPRDTDDPPRLYQFSVDTTSSVPPAWRAPDANGVVQSYAPTFAESGREYEIAIGNLSTYVDYDDYADLDARIGQWWGGMSTAKSSGNRGAILRAFVDEEPLTPVVRSLMPGAVAVEGVKCKSCSGGNPCVCSSMFPASCRDPARPEVKGYKPTDGTCAFSVVPIVQPLKYTPDVLLDAAQLMCAVARDVNDFQCDPKNPPEIQHPRDYLKAKAFIECSARAINDKASLTVFSAFPERAIDALRKESAVGSFPAVGGTLGQEVAELRAALIQASSIQEKIGGAMRDLGTDFEALSAALEDASLRDELDNVQFRSAVEEQDKQCGLAAMGGGSDVVSFFTGGFRAAITCANALSQQRYAGQIRDIQAGETNVARTLAINNFRKRFEDRALTFSGLADDLAEQVERIDSRLASIEKNRNAARQALSRALYKASSAAAMEAQVTNVGANAAAVARERYVRANKNAVRLAFLAKRAIENRLGVRLSELNTDMPLVEAPATWESTACASTGVDYAALKQDVTEFKANVFADQFIGDYVRKLENLVESYRLANDFHEGDDIAVISLKDDVYATRKDCPTPTRNLLLQSGNISLPLDAAPSPWKPYCQSGTSCVVVRDMTELAAIAEDPELSAARGSELVVTGSGSGVAQDVNLDAGKYVLSWYTHDTGPTVALLGGDGTALPGSSDSSTAVGGGYTRHWRSYTLAADTEAKLVFTVSGSKADISAVMLEPRIDGQAGAYQNTGATATRLTPSCPDDDGAVFRRTHWVRRCMQLCSNGYADACDQSQATEQCFYEAAFAINQRGIENGDFLWNSGFAKGNFNYRISDVAVNFVGTGIIDCSSSPNPASCYASGNLQYSLVHSGPYFVRNHEGRDARIQLFEGNVEHARGLAIERYLTNPLSSDDDALVHQYLRTELRGRPLDGNFTLRVWDKPGVKFDAIADVQLLLKYRYWTRFR